MLVATFDSSLSGLFGCCLSLSRTAKYDRTTSDAAWDAVSDAVGGSVVVFGELEVGVCDPLAAGSLRESAQDVPAASSSAAVASAVTPLAMAMSRIPAFLVEPWRAR